MNYRARILNVLKEVYKIPFKVVGEREVGRTYEYALLIPSGLSAVDIEKQVDALYASCGAVVEIKDRAGVVVLSVHPYDFPDILPFTHEMISGVHGRSALIGFNRQMKPVIHSFRVPHLLIGGMSGYGKTDLQRLLLYQFITRFTPDEIDIRIIDLKGFSFIPFRHIPHITAIARDLSSAAVVLKDAANEMRKRSAMVWDAKDRKVAKGFKWIIVLIDEASQIAPNTYRTPDEKALAAVCDVNAAAISCIGREAGVSLWYCTQRPDSMVLNPQVKQNMEATLAFRCKTYTNSEILLDTSGAEKLPDKPGRVLYATNEIMELQIPYVGNDEKWIEVLKPYERVEQTTTDPSDDAPTTDCYDYTDRELF